MTGREPTETRIGDVRIKPIRTKGAGIKVRLISGKYANVVHEGKNIKCEIVDLLENPANKEFTRRKVITKGAILNVKASDGRELKVKVTSRPGQDGVINAKVV